MPLVLGLSVGESFAEIADASASPRVTPTRWYLPRRNLTDSLTQTLAPVADEGGHIQVATSLASFSLTKNQGSAPAFLVTAGFEPWLSLHAPIQPKDASAHPTRAASPLNADQVFGISERLSAKGEIETPVSIDDLQFLAAKLEMLKTKTIAVGLLHADRNPESEIQIRDYFKERGYQVFCSHEQIVAEDAGELARWWRTVHSAYASSALKEQREQITAALGEHKDNWTIEFIVSGANAAELSNESRPAAFNSNFGNAEAIRQWAKSKHPILHLGLERFQILFCDRGVSAESEYGCPTYSTLRHRVLDVKPSTPIEVGLWPGPSFGEAPKGFEPGPMSLGKAHGPTILDILFVLGRIEPIETVTPLLNEKSRGRILESLFTLSKGIPSSASVDPMHIARDLETLLIERINLEISASLLATKDLVLTGALARTLHPLLERRRPDLRFQLAPDAEWAEAQAVANFVTASDGATR